MKILGVFGACLGLAEPDREASPPITNVQPTHRFVTLVLSAAVHARGRIAFPLMSLIIWLLPGWADAIQPSDPLNIVMVIADDLGGPYVHAYASVLGRPTPADIVKTPNIDRLAAEGVLFANAFANSPTCTASRSSILSGRHAFNVGTAVNLGGTWDVLIPSAPLMLHEEAGYHLGVVRKGWGPGRCPNGCPLGDERFRVPGGGIPSQYSEYVTEQLAAGVPIGIAKQKVLSQVQTSFEWFLARRSPGQPFFYWFGPTNTHRAWVQGSGYALWGIRPRSLLGRLPGFLPDVQAVREDMSDYLGEIQALDAYVGVLISKLVEIGELERTLFIVTGDNGIPGFPRGKGNLYDAGVRVPLVIRWPGLKRGHVVRDFVTLMDLAPTFLEVGQVPMPPGMSGKSLRPQLVADRSGWIERSRNVAVTSRERVIAKARDSELPYPSRALRTPNFLYIRNFAPDRWPEGCPYVEQFMGTCHESFAEMNCGPTKDWMIANRSNKRFAPWVNLAFGKRPSDELYDLRTDPDQIRNISTGPAYAFTKARLDAKLMTILTGANDLRVTGDGSAFDYPPYTKRRPVDCGE